MEAVIRTSAVSNARWIAVSQVVSVGVQLVGLMWLSRLLTPADYGVVAMAVVVTTFASLLRDMGTTQALIQKEDLKEETVSTCFWFTAAVGAVLGLCVAGSAPLVALAFKAPEVTGVLWVLALTFPALGATTVQQALLERDSRFPLLARIQASAVLSGLLAGVTAAYLGAGAYSLALQTLVYTLVSSVQLWLATDWRPRWFWSGAELKRIRSFSDYLVGFNIINYFSLKADTMIIGRVLGADSLGPYSLAWRIVDFPLNLTFIAARALFPVMSRQQEALDEMTTLYLRAVSVIAFITAPMMAGLFVLGELFVVVVLGEKWMAMADILVWLAPVGFVTSLTCTTGSVLLAQGRSDVLFYLGILGAVLHVASFFVGVRWGVVGVAAGYCVATLLTVLPDFYFVFQTLGQGFARFLRVVLMPMALAGAMALLVLACRVMLPLDDLPRLVQFLVLVLVGAAFYGGLALVLAPASLRDVLRLIKRA